MVAVGVDNHRVAVIPAHGSVFDDPRDTPFNEIWNEPYAVATIAARDSVRNCITESTLDLSFNSVGAGGARAFALFARL